MEHSGGAGVIVITIRVTGLAGELLPLIELTEAIETFLRTHASMTVSQGSQRLSHVKVKLSSSYLKSTEFLGLSFNSTQMSWVKVELK